METKEKISKYRKILEKSKIKIDNLFLVASKRSEGKIITFKYF